MQREMRLPDEDQHSSSEEFPVVFSDVFGDPNVGVFSFANEKIAILPAGTSGKKLKLYDQTLRVKSFSVGVAESRLIGIYLAGNSNGLLVPQIVSDTEISALGASGLEVHMLSEKHTALGNLIVCNDYGAVVDPRFRPGTIEEIEKYLKIPVVKASIAGLPHVGALSVATDKGVLITPLASDSERKTFSDGLGVPIETGTVNAGVPFPKAGVVANSKGAVVGALTMGRELVTIGNIFQG